MSTIRGAIIDAQWTCYDNKGTDFGTLSAADIDFSDEDDFDESLVIWVDNTAYEAVLAVCEETCQSICTSCFCDKDSITWSVIDSWEECSEETLSRIDELERALEDNEGLIEAFKETISKAEDIISESDMEEVIEGEKESISRYEEFIAIEEEQDEQLKAEIEELRDECDSRGIRLSPIRNRIYRANRRIVKHTSDLQLRLRRLRLKRR